MNTATWLQGFVIKILTNTDVSIRLKIEKTLAAEKTGAVGQFSNMFKQFSTNHNWKRSPLSC